jgi:hypothetical protein
MILLASVFLEMFRKEASEVSGVGVGRLPGNGRRRKARCGARVLMAEQGSEVRGEQQSRAVSERAEWIHSPGHLRALCNDIRCQQRSPWLAPKLSTANETNGMCFSHERQHLGRTNLEERRARKEGRK